MRHLICLCLLSSAFPRAYSQAAPEANPGHWRSSPYLISAPNAAGERVVRIRNLDVFAKLCRLQIARASEPSGSLVFDETLLFKADRALEITLSLPEAEALQLNMGCLPGETSEGTETRPDAKACRADAPSCEQLCPADSANPDACQNDHLAIAFERSSFKVSEKDDRFRFEAELKNTSDQDLSCQFLTAAKGVTSATGDVVYVQLESKVQTVASGAEMKVAWTFAREELGTSDQVDSSRPRVVGLCTKGDKKLPDNFFASCHPLKRAECNWVYAQ